MGLIAENMLKILYDIIDELEEKNRKIYETNKNNRLQLENLINNNNAKELFCERLKINKSVKSIVRIQNDLIYEINQLITPYKMNFYDDDEFIVESTKIINEAKTFENHYNKIEKILTDEQKVLSAWEK